MPGLSSATRRLMIYDMYRGCCVAAAAALVVVAYCISDDIDFSRARRPALDPFVSALCYRPRICDDDVQQELLLE